MKERAIRSKKKNRDVVFLSLGSSDPFGIPLKTPLVYDVVTKREMKKHKIDFHNAIELGKFFQHRTFSRVKGDNKQFVMDTVTKTFKEEITYPQMEKIFDQAGIDRVNAIAYFNQNKSKNAKPLTLDVYIALIEFVKNNRGKDIFVDELPILMNPKSKIIFSLFDSFILVYFISDTLLLILSTIIFKHFHLTLQLSNTTMDL